MSRPVIVVQGLGKRYRIGQRVPYKTLREALRQSFQRRQPGRHSEEAEFWALKDVSFDVKPGEVLGIIGANGAGKTTLLRILSRITEPTEGHATIHGRVGSLLEVGTGFHPELTGRENISLNGAILGMKRAEVARKFDAIVEFSGVERFIDTPLKHYSSGMYVRLAFSVAAYFDPEILLIDEVLAVGDAAFQERCLGRMSEVVRGGRTIVFVTHNMTALRKLCSRALLLEGGCIRLDGEVSEAIQTHLVDLRQDARSSETPLTERTDRGGSGRIRAVSFEARAADREGMAPGTGCDTEFLVGYAAQDERPISRFQVVIGISDMEGTPIFGCGTRAASRGYFWNAPPAGRVMCRVKQLPLVPGEYRVMILLKDEHAVTDAVDCAATFNVIDAGDTGMDILHIRNLGNIVVPHDWDLVTADAVADVRGGSP
jgi:lipopolysaccharide transport system ATP-binding protein